MGAKLNILIAEDYDNDYLKLKQMIQEWGQSKNVECHFTRIKEVFYRMPSSAKESHIAFIDIKIPRIGGIEFAKFLRSRNEKINIIFETYYDDYAIEGYKIDAVDYLLKPIDKERLFSRLNQILEKEVSSISDSLVYSMNRTLIRISFKDIVYIEANNHKTIIHTISNVYNCNISFSEIIKMLNNSFSKIHRSYIVGLKYVRQIKSDFVTLTTDEVLPVGKKSVEMFKEALFEYYK